MTWQVSPEPDSASVLEDLDQLEEFLKELPDETRTGPGFLRERIEELRFYLHGAMPMEYNLIVKLAENQLPQVEDEDLRKRLAAFLKKQHTNHFVQAGLTQAA